MTGRGNASNLLYGSPNGLTQQNPLPIVAKRSPTTSDTAYLVGQLWVNKVSNQCWILTSVAAGLATWALASPGASDVDTVNSLSPVAGDIIVAGGTNLGVVNAGHTITLNLIPAITLATSVTSPLFTSGAGVPVQITAPANRNVIIQLGDAAGAQKLSITNSATAEVWSVNSLGVFGALAGMTVTGALTQTAGVVNIGQDNAANAINIGAGNVARAIAIGAGAAAHTVAIGSASAGAMSIDSAAGISLDSATASNFTVTGVADLTLASTGGSVNITATEAAVDAIAINASNAAGGIDMNSGTGGIDIDSTGAIGIDAGAASNFTVTGAFDLTCSSTLGRLILNSEKAAADAVRILSVAGGLDTNVALQMNLDSSQAAADAVRIIASNAAGGIDVNAGTAGIDVATTGVLSIDSAGTSNLTTTGAFDFTVSSTAGSVIVSGGEAVADAVQITSSNAAGGVLVTTGTGGFAANAVGAAAPITLDAVGVLELNSSGAAISIGQDAANFAVNVGTGGTRTVTLGSATLTSSTVINCGTGAANIASNATDHTTTVGSVTGSSPTVIRSGTGRITVTGTVKEIDAEFLTRSGVDVTFQSSPIVQSLANTGAAPTGATGDVNLLHFQEGFILEEFVKGAGETIIAPRMTATGLLISGDLTATEGYEINAGAVRANSPLSYTIGTSPAFFAELSFTPADVSGLEPAYFGFRKTQANDATYTNYTDFVGFGIDNLVSTGKAIIQTQLNTGGLISTDTTDAWVDNATHTLRVLVSAAGVVTFTIDGIAPAVTQAFTFDAGDVVHFWWTHVFGLGAPGTINWNSIKIGFQP
jgi:hypothetical protein